TEQGGQCPALAAIDAEERRVLRNEQQLANALPRKLLRLANDGVCFAAPVLATQRRDDAERARVVAAFADFHVRVVLRCRQQSGSRGVVEIGWWVVPRSTFLVPRSCLQFSTRPEQLHRSGAVRGALAADRADDVRHLASAQDDVDLRNLCLQLISI